MEQPIPADAYEPPPPPDPVVIQKKKNIKLILLIVVFLTLIRLFVVLVDALLKMGNTNDNKKYSAVIIHPQTNQNITSIIGVIRESGLNDEEKQNNNLQGELYQITDFGGKSFQGVNGLYLLTDNNQAVQLVGKCVRADGFIPKEWQNKQSPPYQRKLFQTSLLTPLDFSNCDAYIDSATTSAIQSFDGILERMQRPAPDINYDYQVNLTNPIISSDSASGSSEAIIKQIPLVPKNDKVWEQMEGLINKEVALSGPYVWGFAESKYVLVNSLVEKKEVIDLSNQTYFVDTSSWESLENSNCGYTLKKPASLSIASDSASADPTILNASFSNNQSTDWLNMTISCIYNDGRIPLKQLVAQSKGTVERLDQTYIKNQDGYMHIASNPDGTKNEIYLINMPDGKVFKFVLNYSPGSSFTQTARTILATVNFK